MSVLKMLARAETSSDLQHHEHFCDVNVLAAAGMASAVSPAYLSLYRLKYISDIKELATGKSVFINWMRRAMLNRRIDAKDASRLGTQALHYWLNGVCPACEGRGRNVVPGTPSLSDKPCQRCDGTGAEPMRWRDDDLKVVRDVLERADTAMGFINTRIDEKLK